MATMIGSSTDELDQFKSMQGTLRADGVEYCLAAYVDVHGIPKCKAVPIDHFVGMMQGSELFTGAALDGLGQEPSDDELSVRPDPDAITILPWEPSVAWAPGQLYFHGDPWPMDSRTVLQRQVDRAAQQGLIFNLGIETEFFLVKRENGRVVPANSKDTLPKAAYDIVGLLENMSYMDELAKYMNVLGWDVHSFDHEDANGQFEFDFSHTDAMTMSDRLVLWRMMTKTVARRHGCEATFMPKPYADRTGSGGHYNMSLADINTGENLFADADDPRGCGVSPLAYHFIAGILRHAPAICAVTASTVNAYKRLIKTGSMTGFTWAPVFISYGDNNRTHMLRIPKTSPRVESRAVDMTTNPYLGAAMMLAAGLEGLEQKLEPGDPLPHNMYVQSEDQLRDLNVATLPRTLLEAVEAFEADELSEHVMGSSLKESFVELKKAEWWEYHNAVSEWELDRYLTFW